MDHALTEAPPVKRLEEAPAAPRPKAAVAGRLVSLDALRGFDMFWIIGGREVLQTWANWLDSPGKDEIYRQFHHVRWEGFVFYDLIFPLFLFVVGAVLPFSMAQHRQRGDSGTAIHMRILRRAILLILLGLLYGHALKLDPAEFRLSGVLQRIGICYFVAALFVVHTGVRVQTAVLAALLLGYWALLAWVPAPGSPPGDFTMQGSLPGWVDRNFLPGKLLYYGHGDNEGILSTFPAVGTTLLGVLAGHWLRSAWSAGIKVLGLVLAGLACLGLGSLWGQWFPIIKNIWTSSYVLVAGGWSLLLLAVFYGIIDGLGYRRWAFFFVVIGANAITIYVARQFINFSYTTDFFLGGLARHLGGFGPVSLAMGLVAIEWLLLLYLYRNRIFLRV